MRFVYNDGGRSVHGFKGESNDCVCRAIAIAAEMPYDEIYQRLANGNASQRATKRAGKRARSANNGIITKRKWFKEYMGRLGFKWIPTMTIGSGCTVHLRDGELPSGRLVVSVSKHLTAVIDGVVNDTHSPERESGRCVYGYWKLTQ